MINGMWRSAGNRGLSYASDMNQRMVVFGDAACNETAFATVCVCLWLAPEKAETSEIASEKSHSEPG